MAASPPRIDVEPPDSNPAAEWPPLDRDWEYLRTFLPPGWEEDARRLGAVKRARNFKDAAVLLRVLLIHLANGCSLAETALRARQLGLAEVSSVAIFDRLRAAEDWLRHLALSLRGPTRPFPGALKGWRIRAVDATSISEPGSTGTDWRIHYSLNLADLSCDHFELSDAHVGESLRHFPLAAQDIIVSDRAYATPPSISFAVEHAARMVVRVNLQSLPLQTLAGETLDPVQWGERAITAGRPAETAAEVMVRREEGRVLKKPRRLRGRLIGMRCTAEVAERGRRHLRDHALHHGKSVSARAAQAADYFFVWTNLESSLLPQAEEVLEIYRLRWQVELAFKRLKSLMNLGHLPKKDPASSRAWLYGKLLVGLLAEAMVRAGEALFPWGYELRAGARQPLARD